MKYSNRWVGLALGLALLVTGRAECQMIQAGSLAYGYFANQNSTTMTSYSQYNGGLYGNAIYLSPLMGGSATQTPVSSFYGMDVGFAGVTNDASKNALTFTLHSASNARINSLSRVDFQNASSTPEIEPTLTYYLDYKINNGSWTTIGPRAAEQGGLSFDPFLYDLNYGDSVSFRVYRNDVGTLRFGNYANQPFENYNAAISFAGNATVQAVPEPGTMILTGLALTGMGGAAWRRRRKQQADDTAAPATTV